MDFRNDILVSITKHPDGEFYGFSTYDREHGKKGEFLIHESAFDMTHFTSSDFGSFANIWRYNNEIPSYAINFVWLNNNYSYEVSGFTQLIKFTCGELLAAKLNNGKPHRFISDTRINTSRVILLDSARETIARAISNKDKAMKRALSKAIRDNFYYNDNSTTTLYNDAYTNGFFFRNSGGISGVLCPSTNTITGKNGKTYTCIRYTKHT